MTVFIFAADYGKTCRGRGHIVSPRAQLIIVIIIITSAKEVMFLLLTVCQSAGFLKKLLTNFTF